MPGLGDLGARIGNTVVLLTGGSGPDVVTKGGSITIVEAAETLRVFWLGARHPAVVDVLDAVGYTSLFSPDTVLPCAAVCLTPTERPPFA